MSLWERYSALTEVVEQLERAVASGDTATAEQLAGPGGVPLGGAAIGPLELLAELQSEADAIEAAGRQLSAAWSTVVPRLTAAAERLARVTATAAAIGVSGEPSLATARRLLDRDSALAQSDPLSADSAAAEEAVATAERRIGELEAQQAALPGRLSAAERLLADLDRTVADGREALDATRRKILRPTGLLEPIDPVDYDSGPQGLRAWLGRLVNLASEGSWLAAGEGLDRWEDVAAGWVANARAVLAANRAALDRRAELRGLLDAYAAKAAAIGRAEDPALADLHDAAHDALHTAPCDLDAATTLVTRYTDAVRSGNAPESALG